MYTDSPLRAFEGELGVRPSLGFWDPAGLSADGGVASFTRRRSVKIKHGHICMLATTGYITPEVTGRFPGYLSPGSGLKFADVPNGLAAIGKVLLLGWLQIFGVAFFVEYKAGYDADVARGTPWGYGWKPPLLATGDAEKRKTQLAAELANGRFAMTAIQVIGLRLDSKVGMPSHREVDAISGTFILSVDAISRTVDIVMVDAISDTLGSEAGVVPELDVDAVSGAFVVIVGAISGAVSPEAGAAPECDVDTSPGTFIVVGECHHRQLELRGRRRVCGHRPLWWR